MFEASSAQCSNAVTERNEVLDYSVSESACTAIIGTHEHESHFVFDILHNNTTDIQPERHSTDTHGTNQVNFWLLFFDGYQFAPRYRDLHKRIASLVHFRHPAHHAGRLIKPVRKTRDALIVEEWPNIQRIIASLAQKDVTQATVVRKLSSYARQNQTKKALWELSTLRLYCLRCSNETTFCFGANLSAHE